MNNLQIGKMYLVKKSFWLLFPTKELNAWAECAAMSGPMAKAEGAYQAAKWFGEYNYNVAVVEENTCFVLLEQDNIYFKLLNSNGNIGWIYCRDFSKHFELVKE